MQESRQGTQNRTDRTGRPLIGRGSSTLGLLMSRYEVWNLFTLRLIARYKSIRSDSEAVRYAQQEFAETPWQEYMILETSPSGQEYRFVYFRGLVGETDFVISNILEEEDNGKETYQTK